jgi:hypothetical protein
MSNIFETMSQEDLKDKAASGSSNVFYKMAGGEEKQSSNVVGDVVGTATALGALGGAGLAAAKGYSKYKQPWNERNALIKQIQQQQSQLGMGADRTISSLPQEYGQQAKQAQSKYSSLINEYNSRSMQATKVLQNKLATFENTVLNADVDSAANFIKTKSPEFFKSAYSGYKAGLDAAESIMVKQGVNLNTLDFDTDVIQKTITSLEDKLPPEKFRALKTMVQGTAEERPITLSQAKSYMKSVATDLPPEGQYRLTENWGNYLEKYVPEEARDNLKAINRSYKPIAESRATIDSLSKRATGEFHDKGIYNLLKDYAKKGEDASTKKLLNLFSEGNEIASGMGGLSDKVSQVEKAGAKAKGLEKAISQTAISKQKRLIQLKQEAKLEIDNLLDKKIRASVLVERVKVAQKKIDARSIANKVSKFEILGTRIPNVFSKGLPIIAGAPQAMQAYNVWRLRNDPEAQYTAMMGGELAPQGSEERKLQLGRLL